MFEPTVIFQRTQAGRDEIYEKQRRLTQSERLVLIMVDGTTSYQGVRNKLPVLTEERFQRALTTLHKKELILEVFLPIEGQQPEEMEQTVIDRFIQQESTDPLTIISFDPEEDFGIFGPAISATNMPQQQGAQRLVWLPGAAQEPAFVGAPAGTISPVTTTGIMDEALIEQADALGAEVRAQRPQYANPIEHMRDFDKPRRASASRQQAVAATPGKREKLHWGYWMIGIGFAFIIGFLLARFTN
ncbi:hypothetical protein [Noviherbaspirillum sp. UKPF54]|uniref:hypothetical protein n=1 Tax=Noviherbaspirillum sp. UKPF54 TaxID=2601898 RepID=UPI0011B0FFA3|nr:hypothetical protein [Noviherbaspirillum sp. UKPF54]QDZ29830.1 hypothetical protein FAY22_18795 [Noviherbaspirillum sp. UKPF54]